MSMHDYDTTSKGTGLNPPPEVRNAPGGRIREGPENRGGSPLEVRNVLTDFGCYLLRSDERDGRGALL